MEFWVSVIKAGGVLLFLSPMLKLLYESIRLASLAPVINAVLYIREFPTFTLGTYLLLSLLGFHFIQSYIHHLTRIGQKIENQQGKRTVIDNRQGVIC